MVEGKQSSCPSFDTFLQHNKLELELLTSLARLKENSETTTELERSSEQVGLI